MSQGEVNGEVGLDSLDPHIGLGLCDGAPRAMIRPEPLALGARKKAGAAGSRSRRWAARLPGGGELRPVSGTMVSDGQSLNIGFHQGPDRAAATRPRSIDARQDNSGVALNARVLIFPMSIGAALHYRGLKMPGGPHIAAR